MLDEDAIAAKLLRDMSLGFTTTYKASQQLKVNQRSMYRWITQDLNPCPHFRVGDYKTAFVNPEAVKRWMAKYHPNYRSYKEGCEARNR